MTEVVYQAIAQATHGYVEAPAGCGKTDAIVRAVGSYCDDKQLILTHTNAGVDVLRQRFRLHNIPSSKYHIDTISGWAWGWVRKYPINSEYDGSTDIPVWGNIYGAMSKLLEKGFVQQVVLNSYAGVIVDEYQDCTLAMHSLIVHIKNFLPCRVLGDPLQGIFGFNNQDSLIEWPAVESEFGNSLGVLTEPYRWIKAGNEPLGRWLLETRPTFLQGQEPDFRGSPIESITVPYSALGSKLMGVALFSRWRSATMFYFHVGALVLA